MAVGAVGAGAAVRGEERRLGSGGNLSPHLLTSFSIYLNLSIWNPTTVSVLGDRQRLMYEKEKP